MKSIITATGIDKINELLKKKNSVYVIDIDIQKQEELWEKLEEKEFKEADILVIVDMLKGPFSKYEMMNEVKKQFSNRIFIILEEYDDDKFIKHLRKLKITDIFSSDDDPHELLNAIAGEEEQKYIEKVEKIKKPIFKRNTESALPFSRQDKTSEDQVNPEDKKNDKNETEESFEDVVISIREDESKEINVSKHMEKNIVEVLNEINEKSSKEAGSERIKYIEKIKYIDNPIIIEKKSKNIKEFQRTLTIGVIGTSIGVGVTHTCFMVASYLKNRNYNVAIVEYNSTNLFEVVVGEEDVRAIRDIDIYKFKKDLTSIYLENYDFMIYDFGSMTFVGEVNTQAATDMKNKGFLEFIRCDKKVVMPGFKEWQIQGTRLLFKEGELDKVDYCLAVPMIPEKEYKAIVKKNFKNIESFIIPESYDPFRKSEQIDKIIKEMIGV